MYRKTAVACLLMLGSLVLCAAAPLTRPSEKEGIDLKKAKRFQESLRGKWLLESRTENGKQMDDPAGVYLVVTQDGMMRTYSPVESSEGPGPTLVENVHYRIDATKDLTAIDTTGRSNWTDLSEGICRVENDSLTLCFAAKNNPRPTQFATGAAAGRGAVLLVYKRP